MNGSAPTENYDKSWLQRMFEENPNIKQGQLAAVLTKAFGWGDSSGNAIVTRMLNGTRLIKAAEIPVIRNFFNHGQPSSELPGLPPAVTLPVYDLSASAGDGSVVPLQQSPDRFWSLPAELLPFPVAGKQLAVIHVRGDSMSPELNNGDRVIVDLNDKHPSPAGIFVLDDGLGGVVVKRLELLFHNSPATIKMISTNPIYPPYEVGQDQITISGRVVLKIGRV